MFSGLYLWLALCALWVCIWVCFRFSYLAFFGWVTLVGFRVLLVFGGLCCVFRELAVLIWVWRFILGFVFGLNYFMMICNRCLCCFSIVVFDV